MDSLKLMAIIAFVGFVASEDFCQAFKGHNNTISYVYKQILRIQFKDISLFTTQTLHIIIDGKYWNLVFDIRQHTIVFNRSESHSAPHFTDNYLGAACAWKGTIGGGEGAAWLFPKKDTHKWVNETSIANNTFDRVRNLVEYSEPVTRSVLNMQSGNYSFVYSDYDLVIPRSLNPVIEFAIGSYGRFNRVSLNFQPDNGNNALYTLTLWKDSNNGSYFDHNRQVIGISNQYSEQNNDYGYLVLTKEGDQVYWCWQWSNDTNCSGQLLVDCSETIDTTSNIRPTNTTDYTLLVVILVVAVIITLAIVIVIIYYTRKDEKQEMVNLSKSSANAEPSKTTVTKANAEKSSFSKQFAQ